MTYKTLEIKDEGATRLITITRPKALNSLNHEILIELLELFHETDAEPDIRSVVLTGSGEKSFVAGADIVEMKSLTPKAAAHFSNLGHHVCDIIEKCHMPVIAAVNGFALGGGLELALACDFIYACESATLGLVETKLGLIPGFGGIARLSRRVGISQAKEMVYSARQVSAAEALHMGLINHLIDEGSVVDASMKVAGKINGCGPYANSVAKTLFNQGQGIDLHAANAMEQKSFGLIFSTKDQAEGISAFIEKRKPNFVGE